MLTFAGKGYSPDFTANFERIAALIASGNETIEITFAPDEICAPLLADPACHCRDQSVLDRDSLAATALSDLLQTAITENTRLQLSPDTLARMRDAFRDGTIRKACEGCQWVPLCDSIAAGNFAGTCLLPSRSPRG
jgi:uncharacterized protein